MKKTNPKQDQQSHTTQCFANLHMTPEEHGYWNLFRSLAHATGLLEFSSEKIADFFWKPTAEEQAAIDAAESAKPKMLGWKFGDKRRRRPTRDVEPKEVGEDRPGMIRKTLEKRGWLKCTRPANTVRGADGKFLSAQYAVLSHEEWAEEHPDVCAKRLALNIVPAPKKKETGVTVGKKNRPWTCPPCVHDPTRLTPDMTETPCVDVSAACTRPHSITDVLLGQDSFTLTRTNRLKNSRVDTTPHGDASRDPFVPPGITIERAKAFITDNGFADDLRCTRCHGWGGFEDQSATCQRSGDDDIPCGGTGMTAAQWLDTVKEQWNERRRVLKDLFERFDEAMVDSDAMVVFYEGLSASAKALILDRYPEHRAMLEGK